MTCAGFVARKNSGENAGMGDFEHERNGGNKEEKGIRWKRVNVTVFLFWRFKRIAQSLLVVVAGVMPDLGVKIRVCAGCLGCSVACLDGSFEGAHEGLGFPSVVKNESEKNVET
jgi:hypothetical protein